MFADGQVIIRIYKESWL